MTNDTQNTEACIVCGGDLSNPTGNNPPNFCHYALGAASNTEGELREKLAAIEHERWSDWQTWLHKVVADGKFDEYRPRWERQINTPYAELSQLEKYSDMEQVDRYWPLIDQAIATAHRKGQIEEANRALLTVQEANTHEDAQGFLIDRWHELKSSTEADND
jgi:hypothetical protein